MLKAKLKLKFPDYSELQLWSNKEKLHLMLSINIHKWFKH